MRTVQSMYRLAESSNIHVEAFPAPTTGSLSIQSADGRCFIGIDTHVIETSAEEYVHLAHELGHCMTGSFYNRWAACDVRKKHENCADKWAIEQTLTEDELNKAVSEGYTEIWSLAEHFSLPEQFMRKVVCWYACGNLDVENYVPY